MPVASTAPTTITKGRGRGRGRWAGDPNPSPSPGSRIRNVTPAPPPPSPIPVNRTNGEKSPPQSSSPANNNNNNNNTAAMSRPSLPSPLTNGEKLAGQFSNCETPAPSLKITVQRIQTEQSSRTVTHNGGVPHPLNAHPVPSPRCPADSRPGESRGVGPDPSTLRQKPQPLSAGGADSGGMNLPQGVRTENGQLQRSQPPANRQFPRPAKVAMMQNVQSSPSSSSSSLSLSSSSRPTTNGEIPGSDRRQTSQYRATDQTVSPSHSSSLLNQNSQPGNTSHTNPAPAGSARASQQNNPQTSAGGFPSAGDLPQTSLNVWVQRAQARHTRSPENGDGTPPASPRGGGKSPPSERDVASPRSSRSQTPSSAPVSPRGRGSEGEVLPPPPPPTSPCGKDCSANSDSSADDAELEGLEGLPERVLMFNKRDPVSVLMEYGQTREVKVGFTDMSRSGPHHASRFHTAAVVDGETHVQATGTSKKNAKKAAAILALRTMYDRGMKHLQEGNCLVNQELQEMDSQHQHQQQEQHHHHQQQQQQQQKSACHGTRVMHVSRRLLELAEETQFINYSKDKVLAAIVLERRGAYTVVGLGTGNRCIQFQNLPTDGSRVIHSHAEIIARRAFIRYMLRELSGYRASEKHALFTRSRHTGLLKLHEDIRVHLYISRPPCGDAAAFPTITNFPNRMRAIRKQGQLRTIIDDGEGAIPTEFQLPANANGKERLRVMTCSDKILRWNAVGIQGALLSNFLDPVYLSSVVIGSHTGDQRGHVPRAVSGRLKCGRLHEVLMKPFRICSPEIVYPPHSDIYAITKSKQYCITWSEGDPDAEVIDAVSGSVAMEPSEDSPSSRVSKRSLLALFRQACHNLRASDLVSLTYAEAKASARAYQRTKKAMEAHLQNCGFGQWLSLQLTYSVDNFQDAEKL